MIEELNARSVPDVDKYPHPTLTLFLLARPFLGRSESSPDGFRIRIVLESPRFAIKICVGVIIDAVHVDPL